MISHENRVAKMMPFMDTPIMLSTMCVLLLLFSTFFRPQSKPMNDPVPTRHTPKQEKRQPVVTSNEVVGSYHMGDGLGSNHSLALTKDRRFHFAEHGCLGVYDRNSGSWEWEEDVLVLKPEKPKKPDEHSRMDTRFIPVKWGKRIYLVDEYEMPGFCAELRTGDTVASVGRSYRDYLQHNKAYEIPLSYGKPLLPERYREYYEKGAVKAKVVRIEPNGQVVLDRGEQDRVRVGLRMTLSDGTSEEIKVTSVQAKTATAEVFYFWNSAGPVQVGETFTTGEHWTRPRGTGFERLRQLPKQN